MGFFHEFSGWVIFWFPDILVSCPSRDEPSSQEKGGRYEDLRFWTAVLLLAGAALLLHTRSSTDRNPFSEPLALLPGNMMDGREPTRKSIRRRSMFLGRRLPFARLFPQRANGTNRPLYRLFPYAENWPVHPFPKHCLPAPDGFSSRQTTSL